MYNTPDPPEVNSFDAMVREMKVLAEYRRRVPDNHETLISKSSLRPLIEATEKALLDFLVPSSGAGPKVIQPYKKYHDNAAEDFIREIISLLDKGRTVILDLSNADEELLDYYSSELSSAVFRHQIMKFTNDQLGEHYIQLYFEEAHNLFPDKADGQDIYNRLAKEGAKYHIGMVYSTQSPSTINRDLLSQTENFFVVHLSSQDDVRTLVKANIAYEDLNDILRIKSVGYVYMCTRSHRFVIPTQAQKFPLAPTNMLGK